MSVHPEGLFLNSIPKSGTVLLNNIVMRFIQPKIKIVNPWLTAATIEDDAFRDVRGRFFVGHLPFLPRAWEKYHSSRQILLLRHPRDVCLAYARFYASEEMLGRSGLSEFIRNRQPPMSVVLRFMLTGWQIGGDRHPPIANVWKEIARWAFLPNVKTVTYEELMLRVNQMDSEESKGFFRSMLGHGGLQMDEFPDWRGRLTAGAAPEGSATFSGQLKFLVPMDGFPSAQDLAMLDMDYQELSTFYYRTFLRRDLE